MGVREWEEVEAERKPITEAQGLVQQAAELLSAVVVAPKSRMTDTYRSQLRRALGHLLDARSEMEAR